MLTRFQYIIYEKKSNWLLIIKVVLLNIRKRYASILILKWDAFSKRLISR